MLQVVSAQGDGWVRGYEAQSGKKLWEFDTNPKDSVWPRTRNEVISTPVIHEDLVYIPNGQDPEHGEGVGHFYAIDATKRGDITKTGLIWHYDKIRRSISTAAVADGLVYISDFSGYLHCLDAKTGQAYWTHDMLAAVWGSPFVVDGQGLPGRRGRRRRRDGARQGEEGASPEMNMGSAVYGDRRAGQRRAVPQQPQPAVRARGEVGRGRAGSQEAGVHVGASSQAGVSACG